MQIILSQRRHRVIIQTSFLFFAAIYFVFGSCGKPSCKREKLPRYDYPPEMHRFFDVYKEGNWWVYTTTRGKKRDSVYIANYTETELGNCQQKTITWFREMNIFSTYIFEDNLNRKSVYQTEPQRTIVILNGYRALFQFVFEAGVIKEINSQLAVKAIPSIEINGKTYLNVIATDHVFIAEGVGIIKTVFDGDTFLLEKHHVQPQ